jgi:transposase-like protein
MTENQEGPGRRRRSGEEIKRLVLEFEASGLRQNEFCRKHGLALSTLQRRLKRSRSDKSEVKEAGRFVAVKLARKESNENSRSCSALEVVLGGGRRIEVRPGFDAPTLEGLIALLERT